MDTLYHATPPNLATLHTKPTWHNRAGRVDRSACVVLTAAHHWRHIHPDDWTYRLGLRPEARGLCSSSLQASSPRPHHFGKCDRFATLTLYARHLWMLHKNEQPYPLQGDFRTAKTNALRETARPTNQRGDRPCAQHTRKDPILGDGPTNPNRGVGFNMHKMLGLDGMWQANLRIERFVQHAKLKQHFFVCPVCSSVADMPVCQSTNRGTGIPACRSAKPNPSSSKPLGGASPPANAKHPSNGSGKLPQGRVTKLYLPLCTPQEYEDAQTAELWLRTHCHPNRPWPPAAVALINRYSEFFEGPAGRQLRCRNCLGLRYGEVKRAEGHLLALKTTQLTKLL